MQEAGTSDAFHFAGDASRAADFQGHLQGHLTWEAMPQQLLDDRVVSYFMQSETSL